MMPEEDPKEEGESNLPEVDWAAFLTSAPPNTVASIPDLTDPGYQRRKLRGPEIKLHCESEKCGGNRFFAVNHPLPDFQGDSERRVFLNYVCKNCSAESKLFAIIILPNDKSSHGIAIKVGEFPAFGAHTPSKLITMIGGDRDLFLQGRRSENQGLGIGALAYYRRVVENQKNRIIDSIIKVAEKVGYDKSALVPFEKARTEQRFSSAVDSIKDVLPPALMIGTENPLKLLYSATSREIHDGNDADALELATSIRVVLTELSERISVALKEHAELRNALSKLHPRQKN